MNFVLQVFHHRGMQRVSRKYLSHILASGIRAAKHAIGVKLTTDQVFTIADAAADTVCDLTTMVVQAETGRLEDVAGTFGVDEPWPDWVDVFELHEDFGDLPRARLPELPAPPCSDPLPSPAPRQPALPDNRSEEDKERDRQARTCSWDLDR